MARGERGNRQVVMAFYRDVFNGGDVSRAADYVAPGLVQHDPTVEDGLEGLEKFARYLVSLEPRCEILRCDEAGDVVYASLRVTFGDGVVDKVMDVHRLDKGMIVEHWDVIEHDVARAEREAVNGNGIW